MMITKIGIAAAVALVAFVATSSASLAAKKRSSSVGAESCLGGGCTGQNPDRTPGYYIGTSYYKGSKKKKTTTH